MVAAQRHRLHAQLVALRRHGDHGRHRRRRAPGLLRQVRGAHRIERALVDDPRRAGRRARQQREVQPLEALHVVDQGLVEGEGHQRPAHRAGRADLHHDGLAGLAVHEHDPAADAGRAVDRVQPGHERFHLVGAAVRGGVADLEVEIEPGDLGRMHPHPEILQRRIYRRLIRGARGEDPEDPGLARQALAIRHGGVHVVVEQALQQQAAFAHPLGLLVALVVRQAGAQRREAGQLHGQQQHEEHQRDARGQCSAPAAIQARHLAIPPGPSLTRCSTSAEPTVTGNSCGGVASFSEECHTCIW